MSATSEERNPIHLFPSVKPAIVITESDVKIDSIECLELQWWFAIPRLNERTCFARYDLENDTLDIVIDIQATQQTTMLGIDCTEMRVDEYTMTNGKPPTTDYWYCRIHADRSEWLAIRDSTKDKLFSFQDHHFQHEWGGVETHHLFDDGKYQMQADGSYQQLSDRRGLGAGTYDVTIGPHTFHCLRVIDPGNDEHDETAEVYIDSASGRTVLYRQYRGRLMRYATDQDPLERLPDERFPENQRIVIDGCVYVQSNCMGKAHDVITNVGMGIDLKL